MKLLIAVFFLTSLACCNPAKRFAKQQKQYEQIMDEQIKNHPVRIDTATKFKPGADSSIFYKRIADSLRVVKQVTVTSIQIKYRDTCTTAANTFNQGYTLGYLIGLKDVNAQPVHDTLVQTILQTDLINSLQKQNTVLVSEKHQAELQAEKNKKYLWWFIIAIITNILTLTALLIKIFRK